MQTDARSARHPAASGHQRRRAEARSAAPRHAAVRVVRTSANVTVRRWSPKACASSKALASAAIASAARLAHDARQRGDRLDLGDLDVADASASVGDSCAPCGQTRQVDPTVMPCAAPAASSTTSSSRSRTRTKRAGARSVTPNTSRSRPALHLRVLHDVLRVDERGGPLEHVAIARASRDARRSC